ncbi:hypothetical protein H6F67_25675 [Microcoleus sp. FACHB-1515]|uniref:hypothetical protein n=1 Tax=Cyanophyceae TaxID=3028117 RepID=UPI001687CCB7|nr:hypothetical protein [Microcoleus sp. FACHB-1515]MBD2093238.1 hypothetical protein [Microcoleus sp. FACHB-1515]
MQTVKPEWAPLQAQFTSLTLDTRILQIASELQALQNEVEVGYTVTPSDAQDSCNSILRKIERYVEWTVPELLPSRAEDAEILVNVARFAARLLIQEKAWNNSRVVIEVEQWIEQLQILLNHV